MHQTWEHPKLGTFKVERDPSWIYRFLEWVTRLPPFNVGNESDHSWVGTCSLPAFKVFNFEREAHTSEPVPEHELRFVGTAGCGPSAGAVEIALRVVANQAKLPSLVTFTLWEEFNGRGPKSDMWWHGDMDQVAENFGYDDRPKPAGPDDLLPAVRLTGLTMRESLYEYKKPIAELTFAALFEEEHGVGILSDGDTILGTGYVHDALPYELQ